LPARRTLLLLLLLLFLEREEIRAEVEGGESDWTIRMQNFLSMFRETSVGWSLSRLLAPCFSRSNSLPFLSPPFHLKTLKPPVRRRARQREAQSHAWKKGSSRSQTVCLHFIEGDFYRISFPERMEREVIIMTFCRTPLPFLLLLPFVLASRENEVGSRTNERTIRVRTIRPPLKNENAKDGFIKFPLCTFGRGATSEKGRGRDHFLSPKEREKRVEEILTHGRKRGVV